jgi:hypothetical protein
VATKAKGLPRITISLHPVATSALKDVIADFSLALYASYKTKQEHASREQERVSQLMESLASERVGFPPPLLIIMLLLDEYRHIVGVKKIKGRLLNPHTHIWLSEYQAI